jgi:hypothetical protein
MINLPKVSLILIDCFNYGLAPISLKKSMAKVSFCEVIYMTDIDTELEGVTVIKIPTIKSKNDYSQFILKEAWKFIKTDYVIVSQHDSWVLDETCFDERLYEVDYAGGLWLETEGLANGNGGMSWRSKRLMEVVGKDDFINATAPEDVALCRVYRRYLEKNYGLVWASDEVCEKFSFELRQPTAPTFAFHSFFHAPFRKHIVLSRQAALGDLIMLEPVVAYYSKKNYQVVIDTLPEFMQIFLRYRYRVIHISQMNPKIIPERRINFEMVYENNPTKLVLESYIKVTGEKIPLRNSRLDFPIADNSYVFKKYILLHLDSTGLPHRDCHGVDWQVIFAYYTRLGYQVLQIGKRMKEEVAPYLNTPNIETLMFMIAGADLLIGIDSSPSQIAVALGVPAVIFFGSVNPVYRYSNFENIEVIHSPCVKKKDDFCYHKKAGTTVGVKCKYNEELPPCTIFSEYSVIKASNKLLKLI